MNQQDREQKSRNRSVLRSTAAVAAPTVLSRILGYVRDMLQAYFMGTSRGMDEFTIAYTIPNLLRRLTAEGAMTAAFIPVFTQIKEKETKERLWRFANLFFYDLAFLMTALTVVGILAAPLLVRFIAMGYGQVPGKWELTIHLTRVMFPYIFVISMAALAMAILNSFRSFFVPAFTPVLFNLSIIAGALFFAGRSEQPSLIFAGGVVLGGVLQLVFQLPFLWKRGMRFTFGLSLRHPAVRRVAKLMIPGIFGVGIAQINLAISRMIASSLEAESVAALYYSSRVQELTLGIFSIALSIALLPTFSELAAHSDMEGMKRTLSFSMRLILFISMPATAGLLVLSRPIIQILFQRGAFDSHSTALSSGCLFFFAIGIPFISGVKILTPAFYSLKDTRTPVYVAAVVMFSYIGLALLLMGPMQVSGLALAYSLSSFLNFLALFYLLGRKIGPFYRGTLLLSALKSTLFAAFMGGAVWIFFRRFDFESLRFPANLGVLGSAVIIGIVTYVLLNLLFNHEDLRGVRRLFSREKIAGKRKRR
jgi:putative peptidoglycan lipid II flippase